MEGNSDGVLQRTSSQTSATSTRSHKSGNVRTRRKNSSAVSTARTTPTTATTDKSLTSFPSLSPENSPLPTREGRFNASAAPRIASEPPQGSAKHKSSAVETLLTNTPSFRGRSALFEDSPTNSPQHVPGALNLATDESIKRLIGKTGAVALVRQLAEDLAQRDAEITTLRRRAEERERELKKMLREVEVSNLDIETRLHHLEYPLEKSGVTKAKSGSTKEEGRSGQRSRASTHSVEIDEMMDEAMAEDIGIGDELYGNLMNRLGDEDGRSTIKVAGPAVQEADSISIISSIDSRGKHRGTVKGWKDYLWSNTDTVRKKSQSSSVLSDEINSSEAVLKARAGSNKRRGLNEDLFQPIGRSSSNNEAHLSLPNGMEGNDTADRSRASSLSVASWTIKLFAGNQQISKETEKQDTVRGRSVTSGGKVTKSGRDGSKASTSTTSSARAALMRVSSRNSIPKPLRKSIQPLSLGPNGAHKGAIQSTQSLPPGSPASLNATADNLGPVEMDTILPHGSRPPTLTPFHKNADDGTDYLTDSFGFIYDQRRKRDADALAKLPKGKGKSTEMLANTIDINGSSGKSVETTDGTHEQDNSSKPSIPTVEQLDDKPTKRWQDYLKVATFPTELLSHTPSPSNIMTLANADIKKSLKRSPTFGENGENLPSQSPNPRPSTSSITAENAVLAKPSMTSPANASNPANTDIEPVKLLLAQLTELHKSLQREKTIKWNEFMRKIRAERRREGEYGSNSDIARSHQANMPEVSLTDGEMIGIATLGNKGKIGRAKYREFKNLVLAGIPVAHRAKVWAECSGAAALRVPGYYDDLISHGVDDPIILAQIDMDINRTLTDNVFFRKGPGVSKLKEVLLAYSRHNTEVGYCQGMNLITASLLLIMPTAEDTFWVLVSMIENILPRHYYDNSLLASRADQQVLREYVTELLPRLSDHLDALGIELEALTFQWFLSLFTDCLSAEALYRVWDVLLCCKDEDGNGGSTFLFQVALALLKLNEAQLLACETPGEVYAYLGGEITNHAISIDGLIRASEGLKSLVKRREVEERRHRCVEVELETVRERERIRGEVVANGTIRRKKDDERVETVEVKVERDSGEANGVV
ncbi:MAG: hypothetical protein MMC33_004893 [Icmadophila ericetorum]|nr:hypothetical protein [Icmadophila ericetorum]